MYHANYIINSKYKILWNKEKRCKPDITKYMVLNSLSSFNIMGSSEVQNRT